MTMEDDTATDVGTATATELDHRSYWRDGVPFDRYLESVEENERLWQGNWRKHASPPDWARDRARAVGGEWRLLVLSEDWCGDACNTVPVLAGLADAAPNLDLRVVQRDENPELMDRYTTDGSRSIPVAIVLDAEFEPRGRWGPRPEELQEFVLSEKRRGERPNAEIYREARRWYAEDGGETTLRELLEVLEEAAQ